MESTTELDGFCSRGPYTGGEPLDVLHSKRGQAPRRESKSLRCGVILLGKGPPLRPSLRFTAPLIAALMLSSSLLSGCSAEADPEPKFDSPTSSASPTAAEADEPPPAKDPTRSAKALIRHWNDLQNAMQVDGDTTAWRELTTDCKGCLSFADQVDDIYAKGGYIQTDGQTIKSIKRDPEFDSPTVFRVHIDAAPTEYTSTADGPTETFPGGQARYRFYLDADGASWSFRDYAKLAR